METKWKTKTKNFLSSVTQGDIVKMSSSALLENLKKGRKLLLQRIRRIDKEIEKGRIQTNYIKERYEKYKLGKLRNLTEEQMQLKLNYMQGQLNRQTSTIEGTILYENTRSEINNLPVSENKKSELWAQYRRFEEDKSNENYFQYFGSDEVQDMMIDVVNDPFLNSSENEFGEPISVNEHLYNYVREQYEFREKVRTLREERKRNE